MKSIDFIAGQDYQNTLIIEGVTIKETINENGKLCEPGIFNLPIHSARCC